MVMPEVYNLESSAVVNELELAINRALYFLWILGNQYIVGIVGKKSLRNRLN